MAFVMGQHLFLVIVSWSVQNYCLLPSPFVFPSTHFKRDTERKICFFGKKLNWQEEKQQTNFVRFGIEVFSITFARLAVAMPRPFPPPHSTLAPIITASRAFGLSCLLYADSGKGT